MIPIHEQPYPLPDGWQWCRLDDVAKWGSGGTPSRKNPQYFCGNIPWIKTGELNDGYIFDSEEKITANALKHSRQKSIRKIPSLLQCTEQPLAKLEY